MKIKLMSWNTRLYMQGNYINKIQEDIDEEKSKLVFDIIKKHVDADNGVGVAILQEIPYRINAPYKKGKYDLKKWDKHPIFSLLMQIFPKDEYDVLYDNSNKWRIIQTVVIAQKGKVCLSENMNSNSYYNFNIEDLECLAVHSNNAFELRNWLKSTGISPMLIAGDFNAGNYIMSNKKKDNEIAINRQNYLLLTEGYIDLFQGVFTTNYCKFTEPRQIDHVLIKNSYEFSTKYDYENIILDTKICLSDHFPLYWTLIKKGDD